MKKNLFSAALFLLSFLAPAAGQGNTAMPFVQTGRNPVSVSMAGAAGVLTGNPYASLENMAAAAFSPVSLAAGASYQIYSPSFQKSTSINAGALYRAMDNLVVSASFVSESGEPYDVFTISGSKAGTFTPKEMIISGGAAYQVTENIAAGAAAHYVTQTLSEKVNLSAICLDAHVAYCAGDLLVSAGVSTIGGSVESQSGKKDSLPSAAVLSGTYHLGLGESLGLDPYLKGEYFLTGGIGASAGAQFSFKDMVFVRAGYHLGTDGAPVPSFAAAGLGFKFMGVGLDLAYILASETLGGSLLGGLTYAF